MFKLKATSIIQDYFLSDDIGKVIWSFQVLAAPDSAHGAINAIGMPCNECVLCCWGRSGTGQAVKD